MTIRLPIDKTEFEKGESIRALGDRILEFLETNKGRGYLEDDIGVQLMQTGSSGGNTVLERLTIVGRQAVVLAALDNLMRDGKIVARTYARAAYYMYNDVAPESQGTEKGKTADT